MAVSFVAYKGKWPRYCGWLLSWRNSLIPLIVIYPNFSPLRGPSDRRPERDGKTAWVRAYKASHVYPLKGNLCPVNNLSPSPTKVARFFSYLYDRDPLQRGSKIRKTAPFKFSSQSSDRFTLLLQLLFLRFSFFFSILNEREDFVQLFPLSCTILRAFLSPLHTKGTLERSSQPEKQPPNIQCKERRSLNFPSTNCLD